MVPPPNTKDLNASVANALSNDVIRTQEGFFKALKEELLKTTLPMIRESNGDYFVFDLFDMFTLHMFYDNTILTNIDCAMFAIDAYRQKPGDFTTFFPFDLPVALWYGYVKLFMDEIVIQNRLFLSNLFLVAESVSYVLENELFTDAEKDWLFYRKVDELMPKPYTDAQLQIIRDIFREALEEGDTFSFEGRGQEFANALYSFEPIFEKFLVLFENDNLAWIAYLLQAEKLNPDHPETLQYLLHYATALEDEELIEYYESRLRQR